ncbi:hypothetical protein PC110_g3224 [Phytophthora cactorum]|uniref:Uncharacterized protein n=1 Tax=Phytophthora cactorum TaxID=29920 RepID=A0A329SUA7_9STRA|nr:hypothetical protein PC110_g3224 [Phytophthora cactorum]
MEDTAAVESDAAPPHPVPEVIVISDDDESEDDGEAQSTNDLETFSWTDVADRLLLLAKNRELRDDHDMVDKLLRDLGIPLSSELQRSLRATSETLGALLMLLQGHDRRYRACEDLVIVICEVLSLAQTTPCQSQSTQEQMIKEESAVVAARSSDGRACAVGVTMSRLNMLNANCTREIEHLHNIMIDCKDEMQSAAEEFVEVMGKCRAEIERQCVEAEELELRVFEDTYNKTSDTQCKYYDSCKARKSLEHRALELEMRRSFYQAALTLVCTAAQLVTAHDEYELQERTTGERINALGSNMLENMDSFCYALEAIMVQSLRGQGDLAGPARGMELVKEHRPELLHFAKHLEQFWLIHRNWLPPMLLDVVIERFDTLSESNGHTNCPVANAVSRVCASLRAGYST